MDEEGLLDVLMRVGVRLVPVTISFPTMEDAWAWYEQQYDNPRAIKMVSLEGART